MSTALNQWAVRDIEFHKLIIETTDGRIVHLVLNEFDYEIKWMNESVVGYPYVILAGQQSAYGFHLRYEARRYQIIKLKGEN